MKNALFTIALCLLSSFCILGSDLPSVMASGDWYKITLESDGIYRITYSELVSLGITNPENVRIYGLGGGMLPETADKDYISDLQEIPIWVHTRDGVFKSGDYILFYGQGPAVWKYDAEKQEFQHSIHLWDKKSTYFITSKAGGKRITTETPLSAPITHTVTSFDERQFYENELTTLLGSGRNWYGEEFFSSSLSEITRRFSFTVPDIENNAPVWLNISFMARTNSSTPQLQVIFNEQQIASQPLPVNLFNHHATVTIFNTAKFNTSSGNMTMELTLNKNGVDNAGGWLDYIRLFARRRLNMSSSQLFFRDTQSVGEGHAAQFQITSGNSNIHVWDITDLHNVSRINTSLSGNMLSFSATTDNLREFVAFDVTTGLLRPNFPEGNRRTENQNLRNINDVDMIIVTHPDFMDASHELAALHRERDGLAIEVVTAEQIYNEFSSGMQDPAAIRNFMKHLYEKPSSVKLKYLLLMGAGTYDNKSNLSSSANTNFIVTYQSENSWHTTNNSYVSDDYFGILGDDEGIITGKLAIGVGRLPVLTAEQAKEAVAKTIRYMDAAQSGDWHNTIGLLADEKDTSLNFTDDSETLAKLLNDNHQQYAVEKMYLDAATRVATADGHRFPEIEQQLASLINNGCLLVNYVGHGNTSGLSAARLINNTGIAQMTNRFLPIFVTTTCDFGRYDIDLPSGAENLLLNPNGGAIAVIAGSRLVYAGLNLNFNQNLFREMFTRSTANGDDEHRLGDIVRRAKNASTADVNKLSFALLGNPALKPLIPTHSVQTVSIDALPESEPLDALKANSFVTVKGFIKCNDDKIMENFNGVLHFTLFDKPLERPILDHNGNISSSKPFYTQTSTLFKGKTAVENGVFEISFIMPRNINHQYGFGRITYFAVSDDGDAAAGALDVIVGGSVPTDSKNTEGPQISLFMNDTHFRDGGVTDQNPRLIAFLRDETGINTSDEGIGHNITARLSNDPSKLYVLNRHYEADLGSHNSGVVSYRFTSLPVGSYELLFTAWNLENNSSQESIRFRVTRSSSLQISNLYNEPNPFVDNTRIYFEFNMPETELQAELHIYDMSGRLLRSMKQPFISDGYTSGDFEWDGRDGAGNRLPPGIYPYRIILTTDKGQMVQQTARMVIL